MDGYKTLISETINLMKKSGFKKSGDAFFYSEENNIGIIEFQKSRSSNAASISFTINLGVYSSALNLFDKRDLKSKPSMTDCHWRERIGFLLPLKKDYWWQIEGSSSLTGLLAEIINILEEIAIPEIHKHITDESLENLWMAGVCGGLSKQAMYIYLITLLKVYNRFELEAKVEELKSFSKGKPFESNVKENLAKIGIAYE